MPSRRRSARARILVVADRLFYEHGIRAVGVDAIAAGAETAKTTLYSHFRSKDALVVAYLQQRAQHERERLERELAARAGSPADRILHLYDLLGDELAAPGYRGSPFANACVELARDHPAVAVARDHREWMLATITTLAAETGAPDPVALAAQLLQLYESAAVSSQLADAGAVRTARAAAAVLVSTSGFAAASVEPPPTSADRPRAHHSSPSTTRISLPGEALSRSGTPEAHRLVTFLNSAHLPDGDDQLADERAGTWLAEWLPPSGRDAPETSGKRGGTAAAAELLILREGLRQLAAINCGAPADPELVARAATVWGHTPLVVDLATAAQPQLIPAADPSHVPPNPPNAAQTTPPTPTRRPPDASWPFSEATTSPCKRGASGPGSRSAPPPSVAGRSWTPPATAPAGGAPWAGAATGPRTAPDASATLS